MIWVMWGFFMLYDVDVQVFVVLMIAMVETKNE